MEKEPIENSGSDRERSWKTNPSEADYLRGQSLLGRTPEADRVFKEDELERFEKLNNLGYWQKLPPSKIKSNFDSLSAELYSLDQAMEERLMELEEMGENPKTDIELIRLAAMNSHWKSVHDRVSDHPRFQAILSKE